MLTLTRQGLNPSKRGYPDFWLTDENSRLTFVEVKPDGEMPSGNQWAFMGAAARAGLRVMTFRPSEGLRDVTKLLGGKDGVPIPTADFTDKARYLQKGANCQVCQKYHPPGSVLADLVWCFQHRAWRCRGCFPTAGALNVRAHTRAERESEARGGGRERPCTCTPPDTGVPRVRASDLSIESGAAGSAVSFTLTGADGLAAGVRIWVPGKDNIGHADGLLLVGRLGFVYEGP